jgi:hypothetical protein
VGEGLRRGMEWARWATITVAVLVIVLGVSTGLVFLEGHGMARRLVFTTLVELTLIPWIAWRLSLPRTATWFAASGRSAGIDWQAALVGWVVFAVLVIDRVAAGGLRLALPSGKPMAVAGSVVIELAVVPVIAAVLSFPRSAAAVVAAGGARVGARVNGVWMLALLAWSVPWGIVVAITQGIGLK